MTPEYPMNVQEKRIIDLLQVKRSEDPDVFRKYLPDVADLLPDPTPERTESRRPVFGLTEHERSYHKDGLSEALGKLGSGSATPEDAAKGLEHCANLLRDDIFGLPEGANYETLKALIRAAIGKSPGSYRSKTTVPLGKGIGPVLEQISVIRGVYLDLDRNRQLTSISINPRKVRERKKLMEIVGAFRDTDPNVAAMHDDHLAMQDPHGND